MSPHVLIAAGSRAEGTALERLARSRGCSVTSVGPGAAQVMARADTRFDLCLFDPRGPAASGVWQALLEDSARTPVAILRSHTADPGGAGLRTPAGPCPELVLDVLQTPLGAKAFEACLARAVRWNRLCHERDTLRQPLEQQAEDVLRGCSAARERLAEEVERVAKTRRTTVLLHGEPGVGKDFVARCVHVRSVRPDAPFVTLTSDGAGTDAGVLELASGEGATLFLREVTDLAPAAQIDVLRKLEEPSALRVIAATSRELADEVERGVLREDLYYRLNVLSVRVPPLRARRADIGELASRMLRRCVIETGSRQTGLSAGALERLREHAFPGNLKELAHIISCAALAAGGGRIEAQHLPLCSSCHGHSGLEPSAAGADRSIRGMEQTLIRQVLCDEGQNRSRAARVLGINRTTLYNKLRAYGIE